MKVSSAAGDPGRSGPGLHERRRRGGHRTAAAFSSGLVVVGTIAVLMGNRLIAGVVLVLGVIELGRMGLTRIPDQVAARLLKRVVPIASGLLAAGVPYSVLHVLQISPRQLAAQVGLPETGLAELFSATVGPYAGWLLLGSLPQLHPGVQRWLDAARSGRLRAVCMYASCVGLVGVALAPNHQLLYLAVVIATAGGLG